METIVRGAWLLVAAAIVVAVRLRGGPPTVALGFGCLGIAALPLLGSDPFNPPSDGGRLAWAVLEGLAALAFSVLLPEANQSKSRTKWGSPLQLVWFGLPLGAFAAATIGYLSTHSDDAVSHAVVLSAWIIAAIAVMATLGSIPDWRHDRANTVRNLLIGVPLLALPLFVLVFSGVMLDRAQDESWLGLTAHYVRFVAAVVLLVGASGPIDQRPIRWSIVCGFVGLLALASSRLLLLPLHVGPGHWFGPIASARWWLEVCGPALFLLFVAFAPRGSLQQGGPHSAPGLRIQWSWGAAACLLAGFAICAWQIYEVSTGDHFTVWIVGRFIPLPVVVLGGLFVIGGLAGFLTDSP